MLKRNERDAVVGQTERPRPDAGRHSIRGGGEQVGCIRMIEIAAHRDPQQQYLYVHPDLVGRLRGGGDDVDRPLFSTNEVFAHPGEEARPICRLCFVFCGASATSKIKRSDVCIQSGFWIGITWIQSSFSLLDLCTLSKTKKNINMYHRQLLLLPAGPGISREYVHNHRETKSGIQIGGIKKASIWSERLQRNKSL